MSLHPVKSLLSNFWELFFICKILGIYPHDLRAFQRESALRKSKIGTALVLVAMLVVIALYNLLIYAYSEEDQSLKAKQSTLTYVIGLFLTYIGIVMMATDQITAIKNQNNIGEIFDRIRTVDERLYREQIVIDNSPIYLRIRIMITLTICCELVILLSTFILLVDYTQWISLLWFFSCIPTFYSTLDKIWFAGMLNALKQRFEGINRALEELVDAHEKFKALSLDSRVESNTFEPTSGVLSTTTMITDPSNQYTQNLGYLYKELNMLERNSLKGSGKNKVSPIATSYNSFGEGIETPQKPKPLINMAFDSELSNAGKVEEKLNNFCQLHDEICEIGKSLNELWSYPILVLMAYGFLIFTAQLYFLYCATQDQDIPSLFRTAKNAWITAVCLAYTSGKCIYLIYLSWTTSLESKRTGICLHKCGVAADNNLLYEIVNHLSLKLLNHSVDFSACGFFTLDMETLYGVSGGITSYLIILIQFNLAAQQAKEAIHTFSNFNETANMMAGDGNTTEFLNYALSTMLPTAITTVSDDYVTD